MRIPLQKLVLDEALKIRSLSGAHIESLENSDPRTWPPIKVIGPDNEQRYYVVGGMHRLLAARQMALHDMEAELVSYKSEDQVKLLAYEDNAANGLPLTTVEKKAWARLINKSNPSLSIPSIARTVHLSQDTLRALFAEKPTAQFKAERREQRASKKASIAAKNVKDAEKQSYISANALTIYVHSMHHILADDPDIYMVRRETLAKHLSDYLERTFSSSMNAKIGLLLSEMAGALKDVSGELLNNEK